MQIEVMSRGRVPRWVDGLAAASWPRPAAAWDAWADRQVQYPGGGLERATAAHTQALLRAGYRPQARADAAERGPTWWRTARSRPGMEQVGERVRALVLALDPLHPPREMIGGLCGAMAGVVEVLAALLFCDSVTEALGALTSRTVVRLMTRGRRVAGDPLRERFASVETLLVAAASRSSAGIGAGSARLQRRDGGTSSSGLVARVRGLAAVERQLDAEMALRGLELDPRPEVARALWSALVAWLGHGADQTARASLFRDRLAGAPDWTDRAILAALSRARGALEEHLQCAPAKAEALAFATGDASYLAPLVRIMEADGTRGEGRPRSAGHAAKGVRGAWRCPTAPVAAYRVTLGIA